MLAQYELNNKLYTLEYCIEDDIPSHIQRVLSYWEKAKVDIEEQTEQLKECVASRTALKIVDSNNETMCCIYFRADDIHTVQCYLLWIGNKKIFSMICFYLRQHSEIENLYFYPHFMDIVPFRFVVDEKSIRMYYNNNTPLLINLHSQKSYKMYTFYFERYGIKELSWVDYLIQ